MDSVVLNLSPLEVQYVIGALAKRPYEEVAQLLTKIVRQAEASKEPEKNVETPS